MMRGLPLLIALASGQDTALVFVGHARTFAEPAVHASIKANLIDPIGGDVFWYLAERPAWDAATETILRDLFKPCLLYTSPSPRDKRQSRMPSSA